MDWRKGISRVRFCGQGYGILALWFLGQGVSHSQGCSSAKEEFEWAAHLQAVATNERDGTGYY